MNILADASLPLLAKAFPPPFCLSYFHNQQELLDKLPRQEILICRAHLKVNASLLQHQQHLKIIATASSGVDHINQLCLKQNNIQLFDAKGCNAQAVRDYVFSVLAWLKINHLLAGKTAAVIGLGMVGQKVAHLLNLLGFSSYYYDPLRAQHDPAFESCSLTEVAKADLILVHPNLHDHPPYPSRHLLDKRFFADCRARIIINASRGDIVDENALLDAPQKMIYCTDVFSKEPGINPDIIQFATICTPHIAGHSIEGKENAIKILSNKIHQAYRIPAPVWQKNSYQLSVGHNNLGWEDFALQLYNPLVETELLKAARNKEEAFLSLRKSHPERHDLTSLEIEQSQYPFLQQFLS